MEIKMQTPYSLAFENDSVSPVLSTEMIDPQLNDYVVPAITECFTNIVKMVHKYNIKSSVAAFKRPEIAAEFTKLDAIISKRFGIPYKHIATKSTAYAVFIVAPKIDSILKRNIEELHDELKDYFDDTEIKDTPPDQIISYDHEFNQVLFNLVKSIDELEKAMNTTGVVVDLKKAYIYNYPQTAINFIACNIYTNVVVFKWNAKHLTAVLLHEIGHSFTMTEYTYRTVRNTSVLLDSIQTTVMKQNKPLKEALLLAYSKAYGNDAAKKLENKNVVTVIVASAEAALFEFDAFSKSMYNAIDSEQLADQFSGRFGMGAYLAEALSNVYVLNDKYYKIMLIMSYMNVMIFVYINVLFNFGAIDAGKFKLAGYLAIGAVIVYMLLQVIAIFLYAILTSGGLTLERTYDANKTRLIRMRHELVRQIRSYDLDKDTIKMVLDRLDFIDKIISSMPDDDKNGMFNRIISFFRTHTSEGKRLYEYDQFEQLIETLMENNLHVVSAKLKSTL
jgi:predicted Zn-dependent protease with MMP-like domain